MSTFSGELQIELEPAFASDWNNRSEALSKLGRHEEALDNCNKAIELDPEHAAAWNSRGVALSNLGCDKEALVSLSRSIQLDPEEPVAWYNRAECLFALNRWDEGIQALTEALNRFAHTDEPETGDTRAILRNLLTSVQDTDRWLQRIGTLVQLYERHDALAALGQGLVRGIPTLMSPMLSQAAVEKWRDVWQKQANRRSDLDIPVRLLDAAVRYREKHDPRVLLRLAAEERKLLKPLLASE